MFFPICDFSILRRSVAMGQRAPNRATAREDGRGMGAGMKGGTGAALAPRASPPHAGCGLFVQRLMTLAGYLLCMLHWPAVLLHDRSYASK